MSPEEIKREIADQLAVQTASAIAANAKMIKLLKDQLVDHINELPQRQREFEAKLIAKLMSTMKEQLIETMNLKFNNALPKMEYKLNNNILDTKNEIMDAIGQLEVVKDFNNRQVVRRAIGSWRNVAIGVASVGAAVVAIIGGIAWLIKQFL